MRFCVGESIPARLVDLPRSLAPDVGATCASRTSGYRIGSSRLTAWISVTASLCVCLSGIAATQCGSAAPPRTAARPH